MSEIRTRRGRHQTKRGTEYWLEKVLNTDSPIPYFRTCIRNYNKYQLRAIATLLGKVYRVVPTKLKMIEDVCDAFIDDSPRTLAACRSVLLGADAESGSSVPPSVAEAASINEEELRTKIEAAIKELMSESEITEVAKKAAREAVKDVREISVVHYNKVRVRLRDQVVHESFDRMVQLASQRVNIMMVGPAGCGKTYAAGMIAKALKAERFAALSCTAGMSESQLAGWLLPTGEGGRFEYVASPFIECYEKGGAFLLDEIDAADPNVLVFLNTAIAGNVFHLPQRFTNPEVKRHKDFFLMSAANTFGSGADAQYVGRNQLDAATLDRFRMGMIMMDYSETIERSVSEPLVYDWGTNIRAKIRQHGLRRVMSTRTMVEATKMVRAYEWGVDEMNESYFTGWSEDEKRRIA